MATKRTENARSLRKQPIPAEAVLWRALRNRLHGGFKFRRQHQIGPYFADFACVELHLVVEADGESHLVRGQADQERTRFLEAGGWHVMRIWNTEIFDDFETIKEAIYEVYEECVKRSRENPKNRKQIRGQRASPWPGGRGRRSDRLRRFTIRRRESWPCRGDTNSREKAREGSTVPSRAPYVTAESRPKTLPNAGCAPDAAAFAPPSLRFAARVRGSL
jgi:very-short-patch-repair endonuclease